MLMVWSCVLRRCSAILSNVHTRTRTYSHMEWISTGARARMQGRVEKLPRRRSLIFICARIRFMVLFVLCRFYIFGLMIKLFKHMEKCVWACGCMCVARRVCLCLCGDGFHLPWDFFFHSIIPFFWLSFWNVHILLWSPQTFVTTFQRAIRSLTQNCTHARWHTG